MVLEYVFHGNRFPYEVEDDDLAYAIRQRKNGELVNAFVEMLERQHPLRAEAIRAELSLPDEDAVSAAVDTRRGEMEGYLLRNPEPFLFYLLRLYRKEALVAYDCSAIRRILY